jgi:hypothetical protein
MSLRASLIAIIYFFSVNCFSAEIKERDVIFNHGQFLQTLDVTKNPIELKFIESTVLPNNFKKMTRQGSTEVYHFIKSFGDCEISFATTKDIGELHIGKDSVYFAKNFLSNTCSKKETCGTKISAEFQAIGKAPIQLSCTLPYEDIKSFKLSQLSTTGDLTALRICENLGGRVIFDKLVIDGKPKDECVGVRIQKKFFDLRNNLYSSNIELTISSKEKIKIQIAQGEQQPAG